jgi:hypothetical protein
MNSKRFGSAIAFAAAAAATVVSLAVAQDQSPPAPGKCPADPAKALSIQFAVGYYRGAKLVGMTFCHDGASAKATVQGKTYRFTDGVCFRQGDEFNVKIGTAMEFKRKKGDPPGFTAIDIPASKYFSDGVWFGLVKGGKAIDWGFGKVKMKTSRGSAPKGTFFGAAPTLIEGKLANVSVKGSFACSRVLKLPG